MKMRILYAIILSAFLYGCMAAKKVPVPPPPPVVLTDYLNIDTVSSVIVLQPDSLSTYFVESVIVHIDSIANPSVSLKILKANGKEELNLLPYLQNGVTYTFGGGLKYTFYPGDAATLTVYNMETATPQNAYIRITGYTKKTIKQ